MAKTLNFTKMTLTSSYIYKISLYSPTQNKYQKMKQ